MVWICRECGVETPARDIVSIAAQGWTGLDGDTGICGPCGERVDDSLVGQAGSERVLASKRLRHKADRALEVTRLRLDRARHVAATGEDSTRDRARAGQLLEFMRAEVLPLVLSSAPPEGVATLGQRLREQYSELDLFSKD